MPVTAITAPARTQLETRRFIPDPPGREWSGWEKS